MRVIHSHHHCHSHIIYMYMYMYIDTYIHINVLQLLTRSEDMINCSGQSGFTIKQLHNWIILSKLLCFGHFLVVLTTVGLRILCTNNCHFSNQFHFFGVWVHTSLAACMHYHTYVHTFIHAYIPVYDTTCIHSVIHANIHAWIQIINTYRW